MQTTHLGEAPTKRSPIHKNKIQSINIAVIYNLKRIQPKGNGDCDAEAEFDNASSVLPIRASFEFNIDAVRVSLLTVKFCKMPFTYILMPDAEDEPSYETTT